jgi:hypothetical protein
VPVSVASRKAKLAGLVAHRDPDDPDIGAARADLRGAVADAAIRKIVAAAPELTEAQRAELALLLRPGGSDAP